MCGRLAGVRLGAYESVFKAKFGGGEQSPHQIGDDGGFFLGGATGDQMGGLSDFLLTGRAVEEGEPESGRQGGGFGG